MATHIFLKSFRSCFVPFLATGKAQQPVFIKPCPKNTLSFYAIAIVDISPDRAYIFLGNTEDGAA